MGDRAHERDTARETRALFERVAAGQRPLLDALSARDVCAKLKPDVLVALVPGALWEDYPETGADGAMVRDVAARLGWAYERIPTAQAGRLAGNAQVIARWLEERAARRIVLVTLSKGANETRAALDLPDASRAFAHVPVWISVSGSPFGTPWADWLLRRPLRKVLLSALARLNGHDPIVLQDYRRGDGAPPAIRFPATMTFAQLLGFPQREHVASPQLRRFYTRLEPNGPNDGFAYLEELTTLPGPLVPIWATDLYMQGPGSADVPVRLTQLLVHLAAEKGLLLVSF